MRRIFLEPRSDALEQTLRALGLARSEFEIKIPTGTSFEDWAWYFPYGTKSLKDCDKQELLVVCRELCEGIQKLSAENAELQNQLESSVPERMVAELLK